MTTSHPAVKPPPPASFSHLEGRQLAIVLVGVLLGLLFSALNWTIVGTAMPRIVADLGGLDQYAWVATSYLLTSTAAVPIFGKLSDIYGRKWFFIGGMILFMIASVLCGLSQSILQLIIFRGLQGIGGGILMANTFAIIGDLFPPAERGKWQGLTSGTFGVASVLGPALGGWLTDGPGWRWIFYVNLPVGVLAVLVLLFGLPAIRPHEMRPIDWWGATTIVGATVPLLLAFTWAGGDYAWGSPQVLGMLAVAALMTVGLLVAETRAAEPIIPLGLFRNRVFSISVVSMFLVGAGMFGAIMYVPLFIQGVIGESATNSGAILTPMMLSMVVASTTSGQIMSRTGRYKWMATAGLTLMATGLWLLSRMGTDTGSREVIRNMIIMGLGTGMTMPTFTISVQNAFPPAVLGVVTSAVQFFRSIGGTIGVAVMGTLVTANLQSQLRRDLPADVEAAIPPEILDTLNAQALASPETEAELQARVEQLPDGARLFAELMDAMRGSLATAMQDVYILATLVAVIAIVLSFFLRELPLRKREERPAAGGAGEVARAPVQREPRLSPTRPK